MENVETIDDSSASSKITITITGAFFNNDKSDVYVKTNWYCEGEEINTGDLINIIQRGMNDILNENLKGLEES